MSQTISSQAWTTTGTTTLASCKQGRQAGVRSPALRCAALRYTRLDQSLCPCYRRIHPKRSVRLHEGHLLTGRCAALMFAMSCHVLLCCREVNLAYNGIVGTIPVSLASCVLLQKLDLQSNQLTGPIPVEFTRNLRNLVELRLSNNLLNGTLPSAYHIFSSIQYFDAGNNRDISGTIPPEMGGLYNLQRLHLYDLQLSGKPASQASHERLPAKEYTTFQRHPFRFLPQVPAAELPARRMEDDLI
jgi:hypothetical protein